MAAFAPGAHVQVRNDWPETRGPAHIYTPHYVRGAHGTAVRALGSFKNPEDLAFARPAAPRALYHRCLREKLSPSGDRGIAGRATRDTLAKYLAEA